MKSTDSGTSAALPAVCLVLSATASAVLTMLFLRNGIIATADSWGLWEGAVSLLEKGRYEYIHGQPVLAWPPLFPVYLAAIQAVAGQTGRALIGASALLASLNALAWGRYALMLSEEAFGKRFGTPSAGLLAFVSTFSALCASMLSANFLLLALYGFCYCVFLRMLRAGDFKRYAAGGTALAALLTGAALTHNSAMAVVAALSVTAGLRAPGNRPRKAAVMLLVSVPPLAASVLVRALLGQAGSHPLSGHFIDPSRRLNESLIGMGNFFFNDPGVWNALIGVVFFVLPVLLTAVTWKNRSPRWLPAVLLSAYLGFAFLFVIFNSTYISNRLHGRFLWFLPLVLGPALIVLLRKSRLLAICALLCLLLPSLLRSVKYSFEGFVPRINLSEGFAPDIHIRPEYYLTSDRNRKPGKDALMIRPPAYPWLTRWKPDIDSSVQYRVRIHAKE